MKITIIYDSLTGNTKQLADRIYSTVQKLEEVAEVTMFQTSEEIDAEAVSGSDLVFLGFWTDKGRCSDKLKGCLELLQGKRTAIFGTAGFGGDKEYFQKILDGVIGILPENCKVDGSYMCQGKMPVSVRKRYEEMASKGMPQANELIGNFDKALSHPDSKDLDGAAQFAVDMIIR